MGLFDYIKERFSISFERVLREFERELYKKIEIKVNNIKRQIIKEMIAISIILISVLFLVLSIVFSFIEYLHLTKTLSFLIVGIVCLVIGIIIKLI